jgi:hypothetical protein
VRLVILLLELVLQCSNSKSNLFTIVLCSGEQCAQEAPCYLGLVRDGSTMPWRNMDRSHVDYEVSPTPPSLAIVVYASACHATRFMNLLCDRYGVKYYRSSPHRIGKQVSVVMGEGTPRRQFRQAVVW